MALEAITELKSEFATAMDITSYTLKNISVRAAMVIPDDDKGVETLFTMQKSQPRSLKLDGVDKSWWSFIVSSTDDGETWKEHMKGEIGLNIRECTILVLVG